MTIEVLERSVTSDDQNTVKNGYVLSFMVGGYDSFGIGLPMLPPAYWSAGRDTVLRSTIGHEAMWAAAVAKSITKQASLGFTVEDSDNSDRRTNRAQQLLLMTQAGQGWVPFISLHLRDFLLTDNGAFVEIIRASNARGSKIIGLMALESKRCQRTGDPNNPVIYSDTKGREHVLKDYQVLTFSDLPSTNIELCGVGFCAASRAYRKITMLAAIETYLYEKVTGSKATELHLLSGISQKTIQSILSTSDEEQARQGALLYKSVVVAAVMGDTPVQGYRIPISEIPDGFDAKLERDNAYLVYANAIGIALQDLQPLSGQGLGTGTQSVILDEAAEGYGLAAWRKDFTHKLNTFVLPETTTLFFATNDIRDQKARAEVSKMRADTRSTMLQTGEITALQALQMAADEGDVPKEFLPTDETANDSLTDTEKPVDMPAAEKAASLPPSSALRQALLLLTTKASVSLPPSKDDLSDDLAPIMEKALKGIGEATTHLSTGTQTPDEWADAVMGALTEGHREAYRIGGGTNDQIVERALKEQRGYLDAFLDTIRKEGWKEGYASRAQMYGEAIKASYWRGKTRGYPLPAMPGDGTTQCLTRCKCRWEIQDLDGENNADAYWRMGAAEHCQSCSQREKDWAPLQIRNGELQ
jgi:hypothetical protein